jgi:hypothetical protein
MRGAIQAEKEMSGFCRQNTLQHLGDLQLHFHLRSTKVREQQVLRIMSVE